MTANPRARWAEVLNAPADAGPDAAVSAFLRALPADGFLPPAEKAAAVNALAGTSLPVGKDYDADELLREEVRAFAANFWTLPPAERLTAWADLSRRATGERAAAALLALEPGLDVDADPLPDPGAEELAALARALFVLPPRERAIRRNEWLAARASDGALWPQVIAAFAELRRLAPARAALDPQLGVALAATFDRAALHAGHTTTTRAARPEQQVIAEGIADFNRRTREHAEHQPYDEAADARRAKQVIWGARSGCILLGTIVVLSALVRAAFGPSDRDSDQRPRSPVVTPTFRSPAPRPDGLSPTGQSASEFFTPDRVAACLDYENARRAGRDVAAPSYYMLWVRSNRPGDPARGIRLNQPVTFTVSEIYACTDYDRDRIGTVPEKYSVWVLLNKPAKAGTYQVALPSP